MQVVVVVEVEDETEFAMCAPSLARLEGLVTSWVSVGRFIPHSTASTIAADVSE